MQTLRWATAPSSGLGLRSVRPSASDPRSGHLRGRHPWLGDHPRSDWVSGDVVSSEPIDGWEVVPGGGLRRGPGTEPSPEPHHPLTLRLLADVTAELDAAGPRQWDVEGIIVHGQHGALGSTPKAGKGWDVVDLAISIASGTAWLGHFDCPNAGPVALFPGEEDAHELRRRFEAVAEARDVVAAKLPIYIAENTPRFRQAGDLEVFRQQIEEIQPRFTIVDPMYKAAAGADPRSLIQMGEMLSEASDITRSLGSSFLTVPHFNRDKDRKGADRFTGAGAQEWGRFLIAGTVGPRRRTPEGGTEVVRTVDVSGTSIADRTFALTRRIIPVTPGDPDSPLIYEVEVKDKASEELAHPELDYSLRLVLSLLGLQSEARTIEDLQESMATEEPNRKPYTRQTLSTKLNELASLELADCAQDGAVKRWWTKPAS